MSTDIIINGRFLTHPITGVQRYARELLSAFDALLDIRPELRVRLLTPPIDAKLVPALRNIRHEIVGRRQGHAWEQLDLPRHVGSAALFCPGNTAPVASLLGRARVVVTVHDLSYRYFPEAYSRGFKLLYNRLIPLILRRADRVITVSQSERRAILGHYPFADERLIAIQNGGLPTGITEQTPLPAAEPTVLYVGSLSKRKNFPGMLTAAVRLARTRGTRFVFIGSVPQGLTETLSIIPDDVRDHIRFAGQVNDWDKLLAAYRSAHCFLFPSFYEASPLPPIEAMGCGCPVIAGDIASLRERCGDAAHYCDPADVDSVVTAVEAVLDDAAHAAALRIAGYAQAERYSWHNCAQTTLEAIIGPGDQS
ncbi:glycosyltransferase family 1 protein [uncultured Sphingomonas sp.]|uniref:glycosyltransferase family 4 protein n=1 Tax=uncultured Sphingomonas sp. TaxID=158754 RepID=UPI002588189F|nr:glycosyltransferase family 1 protein [uncultured Sphingomonas sp.]